MLANARYKPQPARARRRKHKRPIATIEHGVWIAGGGTALVLMVPVRTVSELNMHEHWRPRQKRAKLHHFWTDLLLRSMVEWRDENKGVNFKLVLTRLAPRRLDNGDNLNSSMKFIRDAIAKWLGVDDKSERFEFLYTQRKSKAYGVEVTIEVR